MKNHQTLETNFSRKENFSNVVNRLLNGWVLLLSKITVNLNASAEKLRTGTRVQHEVLVH